MGWHKKQVEKNMTEQQHKTIKRRLGLKKLLSWAFILGGLGLTAVVLWPLFYTTNVPTPVTQQQTDTPKKNTAPLNPDNDQQPTNTQANSQKNIVPNTTTKTDIPPIKNMDDTAQSAIPQSASKQTLQQPTSVIKKLSYEDKQQQTTITADQAVQNENHTRLQSAEIASDADKSLLQADTAVIDNTTKQVDAQGNVYYRDKDGVEIASDRMQVKQNDHVTAIGGVVITSEGVIAKSESATYTEKDGVLKMNGGVTIQIDQ